jgi:hypothetical protein
MIREFIIIAPKIGNKGEDISEVHNNLRHSILTWFGGYRYRDACGAWQSPTGQLFEEECREYIVACEDNLENETELRELALVFKDEAKQESVYFRNGNGHVEFLS